MGKIIKSHFYDNVISFDSSKSEVKISKRGVIGEGAFATVFRATTVKPAHQAGKFTGKPRAVKIICKRGVKYAVLKNEVDSMRTIGSHPHIIKLFGVHQNVDHFFLILEACDADVSDLLGMGIDDLKVFVSKICPALEFMHSRGIAHGDIKMANVLYQDKFGGRVYKWCDFGMATEDRESSRLDRGTEFYLAPENFSEHRLLIDGENLVYNTNSSDHWAMGILIYRLGGVYLWDSAEPTNSHFAAFVSDQSSLQSVHKLTSTFGKALSSLVHIDPKARTLKGFASIFQEVLSVFAEESVFTEESVIAVESPTRPVELGLYKQIRCVEASSMSENDDSYPALAMKTCDTEIPSRDSGLVEASCLLEKDDSNETLVSSQPLPTCETGIPNNDSSLVEAYRVPATDDSNEKLPTLLSPTRDAGTSSRDSGLVNNVEGNACNGTEVDSDPKPSSCFNLFSWYLIVKNALAKLMFWKTW
ncbi:kinase-like domain-containing protein [Obelidium mucronatum]|nr:kinase-like domain-containing protein [Obelidium mucronatum]